MIKYLGNNLDEFPSAANQTWCFMHTINLVAKAILRSFDIRRKKDIRNLMLLTKNSVANEELMKRTRVMVEKQIADVRAVDSHTV